MPSAKKPKYETTINGTRVRVYATRSEYECLVGEGDINDPAAPVWCFPKIGGPDVWAAQAELSARGSGR
jgi:hypothetical protein